MLKSNLARTNIAEKQLSLLKNEQKVKPMGHKYQGILQRANENIYINKRSSFTIPNFNEIKR